VILFSPALAQEAQTMPVKAFTAKVGADQIAELCAVNLTTRTVPITFQFRDGMDISRPLREPANVQVAPGEVACGELRIDRSVHVFALAAPSAQGEDWSAAARNVLFQFRLNGGSVEPIILSGQNLVCAQELCEPGRR
jgi:hypothetical protein